MTWRARADCDHAPDSLSQGWRAALCEVVSLATIVLHCASGGGVRMFELAIAGIVFVLIVALLAVASLA